MQLLMLIYQGVDGIFEKKPGDAEALPLLILIIIIYIFYLVYRNSKDK